MNAFLFSPFWFPYTPLRNSPIFNSIPFQPAIRAVTPIVRHNFKSIDELLSPIPHSITSTPSQRNGKAAFLNFPFRFVRRRGQVSPKSVHSLELAYSESSANNHNHLSHLDDTGYSSQLLSGSLLSFRQSRTSIDSQENEDDLENIKPTTSSSPIAEVKKSHNESVRLLNKLHFCEN